VREEFFGQTRPASTLIGVAALAFPEMKVEIDAVAAVHEE
jgi:enamine deaminase RidA (YjgF/YER057c/UK114 family)